MNIAKHNNNLLNEVVVVNALCQVKKFSIIIVLLVSLPPLPSLSCWDPYSLLRRSSRRCIDFLSDEMRIFGRDSKAIRAINGLIHSPSYIKAYHGPPTCYDLNHYESPPLLKRGYYYTISGGVVQNQ